MYSAWLQHRWLFSGVRFCLNNVPLGKFTKCVFFSYYSSFLASVLLQGAASCSDRLSFQFRALLYNGRASLFGFYFLSVATPATPNFSPFSALLTETDGADRARLRVPPVSGAPFFYLVPTFGQAAKPFMQPRKLLGGRCAALRAAPCRR